MTFYPVVGASRGIGLEYVRQLASKPCVVVFAVVRNARSSTHLTSAIAGLDNVHVFEADVADHRTLEDAAERVANVSGGKLDYLIHNAARVDPARLYQGFDYFTSMDELDADFIDAYKVNVLGVIHSITAFLPLLRASSTKKIIVLSSPGGDPKLVRTIGVSDMAAYGISKAAALLATTKWAVKLKEEGFVVVALSPGLVDVTGTYGEHGDPEARVLLVKVADELKVSGSPFSLESPEQSVAAQLKVISALQPSDNGVFLAHTGGEWKL